MSVKQNRERMPTVAAIVDQFRPWLGHVVYASENGYVIDRRQPEREVFTVPANYHPTRTIERKK